jgi:hypothetical protein
MRMVRAELSLEYVAFVWKEVVMASRRLLILSTLVAIGAVACSSGGSQQSLPQQQSSMAVPMARRSSPDTHYLYAADSGAVNLYALPLTDASKPVESITGFRLADSVAVSGSNIIVADEISASIDIFDRSERSGHRLRCSFSVAGPIAVALHSTSLYVAGNRNTPPGFISKYADGSAEGGVQCPQTVPSPPPPVTDSNGLTTVEGVAADDNYVYVASETSPNTGLSLLAYPQPLTANEAPSVTINTSARNIAIAVSDTDLYVTQDAANGHPSALADYSLPLSSTSAATTITLACSPDGVAVYPEAKPTDLFLSCNHNIYTYKLPLSSSSTPSVTTPGIGYGLYAR